MVPSTCLKLQTAVALLLVVLEYSTANSISKRQAVNSKEQLWPDGVIYYRFDYAFSARERNNIQKAMKEWEAFTCVKFRNVKSNSPAHTAKFVRNEGGCFSSTGYDVSGAGQTINLGEDCMDPDIVLHELGHTIGLMHEQERLNRDKYISIDKNNIKEKFIDQFEQPEQQTDFGLPYSYRSIMHYGKDFFNKKGKISILAKNSKFMDIIGNVRHLSFKDAWIVNKMYGCGDVCPNDPPCPSNAFRGKNCECWCPSQRFTAMDCTTGVAIDASRVKPKSGRIKVNENSGNVFFWSEHEVNWFEARDNCRNMGGSLVDFKSPSVLTDIEYNVEDLSVEGYDTDGQFKSSFLWTGGNDIDAEGTFRYLDGSKVAMENLRMSRGEPNNGGGMNDDCLAIFPQYGSEFADWDCGKNLRYICKLNSATCHDVTPLCPYYRSVNLCSNPDLAKKCRMTCGGCTVQKRRPGKRTAKQGPVTRRTTHFR